jgi:hypothetical protein
MNKKTVALLVVLLVMGLGFSSPVSVSLSPNAMVAVQKNHANPDLTFAGDATSVYGGIAVGLDVDVVAGFGLTFSFGVPYPVAIFTDGTKQESDFTEISTSVELTYTYDISNRLSVGAIAGLVQYAIPIDKQTTETSGGSTTVLRNVWRI